jgi:uncharacterized cupin superfamily protein
LWELQAGEAAYPYHFQYADEELIVVMRGTPTPEDSVTTLAISSHGRPDIVEYPDSGKVGVGERLPRGGGLRKLIRRADAVDYWHGEQRD